MHLFSAFRLPLASMTAPEHIDRQGLAREVFLTFFITFQLGFAFLWLFFNLALSLCFRPGERRARLFYGLSNRIADLPLATLLL